MKLRSERGSVLIFTMIAAIAICAIVAAFLGTARQESQLSKRSLNHNRALHLAEAGVEEALWALNNNSTDSTNWSAAGSALVCTLTTDSTGAALLGTGGTTGQIRIRIDDPSTATPTITAMGIITDPYVGTIKRQVRVSTTQTTATGTGSSRGGAGMGMIAKTNIVMNNAGYVDSYDSDRGSWNSTTNRGDQIAVTSISGIVQIQNSSIYGQVSVGSSSASVVSVTQGSLTNTETTGGTRFDTDLINTSVKVNLPDAPPIPTNSGATAGYTLPQNLPNGVTTLGIPGATTPTYYYAGSQNVNLGGNTALQIVGPVVLVVNGQLSLNGNGIQVENNGSASLSVYVTGNINANGNGNTPAFNNKTASANNLVVYGVGSAGQNLALNGAGNSTFSFYGPKYNVNTNGNGHWSGSVVAAYISLGGSFHYDIHVDPVHPGTYQNTSSQSVFAVSAWRELTGKGTNYARDTRTPF